MNRPAAVLLRRSGWLLAWGGSLFMAYHLGSDGSRAASDRERGRSAGTKGSLASGDGPLTGKPGGITAAGATADKAALNGEETGRASMRNVDFKAKMADVEAMPPGPGRKEAYLKLMSEWASVDGEGALAAAASVTEPLLRYEMRETALRQWAASSPEAAWKYAKENSKGDLPDNRMELVFEGLGRGDAATSLAFLEKNRKEMENGDGGVSPVFDSLYERGNHAQLVDWAEKMAPGKLRDMATNRIIDRWIQYDRNAAAKYLAAQPPSPQLDRPIERYTYEVMRQNPAETMPWAESINDAKRRWEAIARVAEVWRRRDPAALQNYVSAGNFNEDQKRELLKTAAKK